MCRGCNEEVKAVAGYSFKATIAEIEDDANELTVTCSEGAGKSQTDRHFLFRTDRGPLRPTRRSFAPLRRPHALESACFRLTRGSGGTTTHTLRVRAPHPLRAPLGSSASRGGYIHSTGLE